MTSGTQGQSPADPQCWCCGSKYPEPDLVHLGQHPEVAICLRCAHWLRRRATARHDEQHHTLAGQLRGVLQAARDQIINRGTNTDTSAHSYDESTGTCHNHARHRLKGTRVSVGVRTDQNILAKSHSPAA
jgi:hypothetical protein